jgi:hypothetical protein
MKAIFTKYIGPSLSKPARIKAYTDDQSLTISYTYESLERDHDRAARALIAKMGWKCTTLAVGHHKNGNVYVMLDDQMRQTISATGI